MSGRFELNGGKNQPSSPDSADGEVMLDIEVAAAIAGRVQVCRLGG